MSRIDRSKMNIKAKGFRFRPFRPQAKHEKPLATANLADNVELLVFERKGLRRALIVKEIAYHHVCQGELAGEPYLVTF